MAAQRRYRSQRGDGGVGGDRGMGTDTEATNSPTPSGKAKSLVWLEHGL